MWTWIDCQECEGEGIVWCLCSECEGASDHDKMCRPCHGYGMRPSNNVLDLLGSDSQERRRTRAQTWQMIEAMV